MSSQWWLLQEKKLKLKTKSRLKSEKLTFPYPPQLKEVHKTLEFSVSSAGPALSSSWSLHNPQINYKLLQRFPPMTDWVTVLRVLSSFWIPLLSLFLFCQNGVCFCQHHAVYASTWTHFPFLPGEKNMTMGEVFPPLLFCPRLPKFWASSGKHFMSILVQQWRENERLKWLLFSET